jgi:cytochrome c oxidase subunit 4
MDSHATAAHEEHEHGHPTPGIYAKIGFILFVLTALEVALYEITYGSSAGVMGDLSPVFVPLLLALSAAKFALVAMFYMHLKQDPRLLSGLFVFPLIIAAVVVLSLAVLMAYHHAFAKSV